MGDEWVQKIREVFRRLAGGDLDIDAAAAEIERLTQEQRRHAREEGRREGHRQCRRALVRALRLAILSGTD